VYCLLRYEASDDLHNGIFNNWLVNISGELGKWIEADLLQEHYNRWLEDMVKKRGGDFDNNFYRHTLSPNVDHFLRIKEEIENAFSLQSRGKTHTSPHLRDELRVLIALYKEENLHLFYTGRTLGHAATNQFNGGYRRLDSGKLDDFIFKSTAYADVIADIQAHKRTDSEAGTVPDSELEVAETDNTTVNAPASTSDSCNSKSDTVPSLSPSSTSSSPQSEDGNMNEDDPSNDQLVSGSDYDVFLSHDRLVHQAWYEQEYGEDQDNSSDEDDRTHNTDHSFSSDGDHSVEDDNVYDSD